MNNDRAHSKIWMLANAAEPDNPITITLWEDGESVTAEARKGGFGESWSSPADLVHGEIEELIARLANEGYSVSDHHNAS